VRKRAGLIAWSRISTSVRVSRKQKIIALTGGHREDVRIVREQNVERARRQQAIRAPKIGLPRCHGLVVDARQVENRVAEAQRLGLPAEKADSHPAGHSFGGVLHFCVPFVVAHTAENAGIGFEAGELADAGGEWIVFRGNQVAGHQRHLRTQFAARVDHPRQFGLAEKRAEVDVADLQQAQPIEIRRQAGERYVDLAHAEIRALHQAAVADRHDRGGHHQVARRVEHAPAAPVDLGVQAPARQREQRVQGHHPGGG